MTTLSTLHVDLVSLADNLSCKCLTELGLRHFPLPFPENKTAGSPLPSPLSFIFLWRLEQSPVHRGQLIIPSPVSPVSQTLRGYRHSTHRWKNHQFQLTPSPIHFAQTPRDLQKSHQFLHPRFTCLPTHDQSREHCSIDADMKHFPAFGALPRSSVVGPWPS